MLNSTTGATIRVLRVHTQLVTSLFVLPTGELASSSGNTTIKIWNVSSGKLIRTLTGDTDSVNKLAVLPSGLLVSASEDQTASIWNTTHGRECQNPFGRRRFLAICCCAAEWCRCERLSRLEHLCMERDQQRPQAYSQ